MDSRVRDYLDDKLQSTADLETLDALLENVRNQQQLLKQQLEEARRAHDDASNKSRDHTANVQQKGKEFQRKQGDIDRRLLIVTQSEASDDAAKKFDASVARLQQLEIASGYVELLKEVNTLVDASVSLLGKSDDAALEPYQRLQHLVNSLGPLQEAAEGAAPHLLDHIAVQAAELRAKIYSSFAGDLERTLGKMSWPKSVSTVPISLEKEWSANIRRLLDLQRPELDERESRSRAHQLSDDPPPLLALGVIVKPLEQRFTYHFYGNKPTNRLDKPEYFFSHIIDVITSHTDFLQNALQPLLTQQFYGSDLASTPAYMDATSAFITALLPMVERKVSSFGSQVATRPQLFSHMMNEVLSFDKTLQDTFAYSPSSPTLSWRGLSYYLLDQKGYFDRWLAVERDFALSRYQSIIESPEAGELDYDSVDAYATKPTKAAIRVNDLLETITERYRPISSFGQKLRFLMEIQIAIFDQFHGRLHSGLEAYLTMTSSLGRTVHGISHSDQVDLQGVKGLDRVCRVFGSSEYLEHAMRDWSDDVFFLELWDELQHRATHGDTISRNLGSLGEIRERTSAAVGIQNGNGLREDEVHGALFDETASAYKRLRIRSEGIITETVMYNTRESMRAYSKVNTWSSLASSAAGGSVTAELDPLLRLLTDQLGFLSKALGKSPLKRVGRQLSIGIQTYLWDNCLLRHSYSTAGAAQYSADVGAVTTLIGRFVGRAQAEGWMRKILDGCALLNLPVRTGSATDSIATGATAADEDDDTAWDGGDDQTNDVNGVESDSSRMGLFEAEKMIFKDNEGARQALDRLHLHALEAVDARAVLGKRVELSS
ncbi:hypothetical protein K431DRAFT_282861 [Polychaeton citri CBS 116435]|uniref:RINT-1 family protein n=1 Tax=Polychaeton citri CBS 116435 TaxID=1314669 RepID=A0A9P4QCI1_9PEZI|nr:hypothetical protein K431DRAFT_282861 [Polychaeton citri CBS 116435]